MPRLVSTSDCLACPMYLGPEISTLMSHDADCFPRAPTNHIYLLRLTSLCVRFHFESSYLPSSKFNMSPLRIGPRHIWYRACRQQRVNLPASSRSMHVITSANVGHDSGETNQEHSLCLNTRLASGATRAFGYYPHSSLASPIRRSRAFRDRHHGLLSL
jgi:hypothetical protein